MRLEEGKEGEGLDDEAYLKRSRSAYQSGQNRTLHRYEFGALHCLFWIYRSLVCCEVIGPREMWIFCLLDSIELDCRIHGISPTPSHTLWTPH